MCRATDERESLFASGLGSGESMSNMMHLFGGAAAKGNFRPMKGEIFLVALARLIGSPSCSSLATCFRLFCSVHLPLCPPSASTSASFSLSLSIYLYLSLPVHSRPNLPHSTELMVPRPTDCDRESNMNASICPKRVSERASASAGNKRADFFHVSSPLYPVDVMAPSVV